MAQIDIPIPIVADGDHPDNPWIKSYRRRGKRSVVAVYTLVQPVPWGVDEAGRSRQVICTIEACERRQDGNRVPALIRSNACRVVAMTIQIQQDGVWVDQPPEAERPSRVRFVQGPIIG